MKPYYQDSYVTIYHGNSGEVLSSIDKYDLILTDPPYSEETKKGALSLDRKTDQYESIVPFSIQNQELRELTVKFAEKLTRWCVMFGDWRQASEFGINPPKGLTYLRFGIWHKTNGAPQFTGDRPGPGWEAISFMHKEGVKCRWNGKGRRSVFTTSVEPSNGHPTPKPLELITELVSLFTEKGEIVFDPFMGSGTTLRAAKDLGLKSIGIEIEEKYCELAARRMAQEVFNFNL